MGTRHAPVSGLVSAGFSGTSVMRYGLVTTLLWIGALKFTDYEVANAEPLVTASRFTHLRYAGIDNLYIYAAACISPMSATLVNSVLCGLITFQHTLTATDPLPTRSPRRPRAHEPARRCALI